MIRRCPRFLLILGERLNVTVNWLNPTLRCIDWGVSPRCGNRTNGDGASYRPGNPSIS
jgi:hypothetical protein